jgi:hypothetical protein
MASSITNVATTITLMPILEKLTNNNHTLWLTQVLAVLRGAHLTGYLDETSKAPAEMLKIKKSTKESEEEVEVPNPTIELWKAHEQHVLSYLLTSFSRDVLVQVAVLPLWLYGSTSSLPSRLSPVLGLINTWMALAATQKGSSTVAE